MIAISTEQVAAGIFGAVARAGWSGLPVDTAYRTEGRDPQQVHDAIGELLRDGLVTRHAEPGCSYRLYLSESAAGLEWAHRPGQRIRTHWHSASAVHDTDAVILRAGDPAPDGGIVRLVPGKIVVREVGYGSLPHDVFAICPEDIRSGAECSECITA